MQKQWKVDAMRRTNESANSGWDTNEIAWNKPWTTEWMNMNRWIIDSMNAWALNYGPNESMKQWIDEPMNQWVNASQRINESMDQWHWMNNEPRMQRISESRSHRNNEPTNQLMNIESNTESTIQGISESMNQSLNQWIANQSANESVNQWFNKTNKINEPMIQRTMNRTMLLESMNQWANGSTKECVDESVKHEMNERIWMDGWMDDDWVRYYLLAASSLSDPSLRHPFSQLLLLWAASSLDYFCSELPPSDLFCSFCNPILVFAQPILCV